MIVQGGPNRSKPFAETHTPNPMTGENTTSQDTGTLPTPMRPMDAVSALYSTDSAGTADRLFSRLSQSIFAHPDPAPAPPLQQTLAFLTYRVVKRTTRRETTASGTVLRNRLLERSGHPYARALLSSSSAQNEKLVEGGDPMNGPYMMLVPEVRASATIWDKLFFQSVQSRDVQLRFRWETQATAEQARQRHAAGKPVRLKALAAGTGLSMILAYDRLVRDGCDVICQITDRDPSNTAKTTRLLEKLAGTRGWKLGSDGISAHTEDIFAAGASSDVDVATAVGILEYLQGFTCDTTERRQGQAETPEERTGPHLAETLGALTNAGGCAIVNSYRPHHCIRLLELFGKHFDYRGPAELDAVMKAGGFRTVRTVGSGVIYDVVVYDKPGR
jgi:hypothetical protein